MTKPYFVYLLECVDGTLYTGITTDVTRRYAEHRSGMGARYTRSHPVRSLLYAEKQANRSEASKRESELKKLSHAEKLKLASTYPSQVLI